jgi:hypothetical protein
MIRRLFGKSVKKGRFSHIIGFGLILLLLMVTSAIPPTFAAADDEPLRVNAGGEEPYIDSLGNTWNADQAYEPGSWGFYGDDYYLDRGTDHAISGTDDDRIYQTERYRVDGYKFDLGQGTYTVILHFAETYWGIAGVGQRVFGVSIEEQLVLDDLDIFSEVDHSTALKKVFRGIVVGEDGQLEIEFTNVEEEPEINGIEIFAAGQNTPPELDPIGDKSVTLGESLTFTISAIDPDSSSLTYSAYNLPPGASFDGGSGTFSWAPDPGQARTYPDVHFEVSDGSLTDSEYIDITVVGTPLSLPMRVNAGGEAYTDSLGNFWNADQSCVSGNWGFYGADYSLDRGTDHAISGTDDERIYQTERYRLAGYRFDVVNGTYTVILHFAETYSGTTGPDQRVFDVSIEGQLVLDDLDIFSEVGYSTALTKVFSDIHVTDGLLEIEFVSSIEAPEINGIEILADGQNTPSELTVDIKSMAIQWAFDGRRWSRLNKDIFTIWGRLKLPDNYTLADLKKQATASIAINGDSGSDTVKLQEWHLRWVPGALWTYRGFEQLPSNGMNITNMVVWWAPESSGDVGRAGFYIRGVLGLDSNIGIDTEPEATVSLGIPVVDDGNLEGEKTITFNVYPRLHRWSYNNRLPRFSFDPEGTE